MRYGWKVASGLLTVLALSTAAFAQRTTGGITGTVKDGTGAVIPGVTVELTGEYVMGTQTSVTNENGVYRFLNLSPGSYNLKFTLPGFADFNRQGLVVAVGMVTEENVTLQLSSVSESVTVTGASPVVDTIASDVSTNYDNDWLKNAPIARNSFFNFIAAAPGVNAAQRSITNAMVYGSARDENSYQLDGTDITDNFFGQALATPNTDSIEEIEILSLGAPAEYGSIQGAVFNIVTKQGSNTLHGDANFYYQADGLTGRNTTASEHIPVARANGITYAVAAPGSFSDFGGRGGFGIQGQASLVNLDGWTVEEMAISPSVGMVLRWPSLETRELDFNTFEVKTLKFEDVKRKYEERVARLGEWFDDSRRYARAMAAGEDTDLGLEALARVVKKELPLLVVADEERQIRAGVEFAAARDLRMVLLGGRDSWKLKDLLREKGIPVILGPTLALPATEDTPYDKPFTTAFELQAAGVRVIFASFSSANSRLLPHEVGNAVAYGLPWEEGLKGLTLYPAQLFGVADSLGTIEEGKKANLMVTDGDPLEIRTAVRYLFVNGKLVNLENKHRSLYEKYRARP